MNDRKGSREKALEELTRKDILESAVRILKAEGMKGFTMERLEKEANLAKGTIYRYFRNKKDLLGSVADYGFMELAQEYESIAGRDHAPLAKLGLFATTSMKYIEKNQSILKELRSVMFTTADQYISDKTSWYWKTVDIFASTLDEAIQTGKIREIDTVKVGTLFLNSINSLMAHHINFSTPKSFEEDVRDLMDLYINGLAPKPTLQ